MDRVGRRDRTGELIAARTANDGDLCGLAAWRKGTYDKIGTLVSHRAHQASAPCAYSARD